MPDLNNNKYICECGTCIEEMDLYYGAYCDGIWFCEYCSDDVIPILVLD